MATSRRCPSGATTSVSPDGAAGCNAAWTLLWLAALLLPPMLGLAREAFAAAIVLWFFPHAPIRPPRPVPTTDATS
jgi:hypothetical protein